MMPTSRRYLAKKLGSRLTQINPHISRVLGTETSLDIVGTLISIMTDLSSRATDLETSSLTSTSASRADLYVVMEER
jgi:hypothetical protein